jgi:cytoskeletal protein RodZ
MSRKTLIVVGIIIIVALLGILGFVFATSGEKPANTSPSNTEVVSENTNSTSENENNAKANTRPVTVQMEDVVLEVADGWEVVSQSENFAILSDGNVIAKYANIVDQRAEDALIQHSATDVEPCEIEVNKITYKGYADDRGFFVTTNSGDTGSIQVIVENTTFDDADTLLKMIQYKHR